MSWEKLNPPADAVAVLKAAPSVTVAATANELIDLACGGAGSNTYKVTYDVPGKGPVVEAVIDRVRNGVSANYPEAYMRRRDAESMVLGDDLPTDKTTFKAKYGKNFAPLREETFEWLKKQDLIAFAFHAGAETMGLNAVVIAPANAGFFAFGLALLQGILDFKTLPADFAPTLVIYVAPPFRHTHFNGQQIVVHNRREGLHEIFSYNLYPGPSAKKGVYGSLLNLGEKEGWVTAHCSTAQIITPYDNIVTIMHEGASGGGKSEMLEHAHRESDGRLLLGRNVMTGETRHIAIPRGCEIRPVTDDMALCHPSLQRGDGKLRLIDAENAWFVRVNHIREYATDPHLERLTAQPSEPLLFLNIDAVPQGRALIWEHTEDAPGEPCPNPRVVIPRKIIPDIVDGAVTVDIRSLGVRTPPCTYRKPSYGIIGLFHILPPALAWLWRLVAPRGHANPSIVDKDAGMTSEGVGSYWPFATGRQVDHANLLLHQIQETPSTLYILCPNQHIGSWAVSFMPQWVAREYLARRGMARFRSNQLRRARTPLLGYAMHDLTVEGTTLPRWFLQVETQPEVGEEAYDEGAKILREFFEKHLREYLVSDLDPAGREIIQCCLDNARVDDYEKFFKSDWTPTRVPE
ncbi:MAG TPA: DUF4914 family protein [Candidatus Hydrogenedentes bacterium]|nr:DUF4914 family protein [Candidatus Hydrogenedentota bacterium]